MTTPTGAATGRGAMTSVSPWTRGFALFAAVLMITIGIVQALMGFTAILRNEIYVVLPSYVFGFDVTAWGWIHLLLGVLVAVAGWAVFSGKLWGRMVGIVLASLSLIANFVFLPHYPLWSIIVIALDVAVIAALCHYDESAADRA